MADASYLSLVLRGEAKTSGARKRYIRSTEVLSKPIISKLHVRSSVSSRFANTVMTSVMKNPSKTGKETVFSVLIPERAFISNFTMVINDTLLVAEVMEKKKAKEVYDEAKKSGESAGLVSNQPKARTMDSFSVSVNVAAESSVTVELTYQQLLRRVRGVFELPISIRPNQTVEDFQVTVDLYEPQGIRMFSFLDDALGNQIKSSMITGDNTHKKLVFSPSLEIQKGVNKVTGINGELKIIYDVIHSDNGGFLQIDDSNAYFVHYFSPTKLSAMKKRVVFVIDVSGSMGGEKIKQTAEAMHVILNDLRPQDEFEMIAFNGDTKQWKGGLSKVTQSSLRGAHSWVDVHVKAGGSTNINSAMIKAVETLHKTDSPANVLDIVILLTDGRPSAGVSDENQIRKNVRTMQRPGKFSVFALGFGYGMNYDFLVAIAKENNGFDKRIYEEDDATTQLAYFFKEIDTALLLDVKIKYDDVIEQNEVTGQYFPQYFNGSEIAVSGKLKANAPSTWSVKVIGQGKSDIVEYTATSQIVVQENTQVTLNSAQ